MKRNRVAVNISTLVDRVLAILFFFGLIWENRDKKEVNRRAKLSIEKSSVSFPHDTAGNSTAAVPSAYATL